MKKILLVCNVGISTSILVSKMKRAAADEGMDVSIEVRSMAGAKEVIGEMDIVLLAPQIGYEQKNLKAISGGIPVEKIDITDFGLKNGEKVLRAALKALEKED